MHAAHNGTTVEGSFGACWVCPQDCEFSIQMMTGNIEWTPMLPAACRGTRCREGALVVLLRRRVRLAFFFEALINHPAELR